MKIFNKYTYLFLGLIVVAAIVILNFIPNLETEEFDQQVIDNIIEGVTTTTGPTQNENEEVVSSDDATINTENEENIIITEEDLPKIEDLLKFNQFELKSNFDYQKIQSLFSNLSSLSILELIDLKKNYFILRF